MTSYTILSFPKGPARLFLYGKMSGILFKTTRPYTGVILKERQVERRIGAGSSQ